MKILPIIALIEGALVMILELLCPQVVAPIFGNSVYMWATLLSFSVLSLAIGYFFGGYLSRRSNDKVRTLILLFASALILLVLGVFSYKYLNFASLENDTVLTWIIVALILIFPLILFGSSTPVIIELVSTKEDVKPGRIYSISTIGGVVGCISTGYFFIPAFGISFSYILGIILTGLIVILLAYNFEKKNFGWLGLIGMIVGVILIFLTKPYPTSEKVQTLDYIEGLNGQIIVSDFIGDGGTNRMMMINRMGQTCVNRENGFSVSSYSTLITAISSIYQPNSKMLVLGLGGGVLVKNLKEYAGHKVDVVELDSRVVDMAYKHFDLPTSGIEVFNEDARLYLNRTETNYKMIVFDIFNGEIAPSHTLSLEAFETAKQNLSKDGILIVNFHGFERGEEGESGKVLYNTLVAAGFHVDRIPTTEEGEEKRNMLYVASNGKLDYSKIKMKVNVGGKIWNPNDYILPEIKSTGIIIKDDYPLMEKLNYSACKKWREAYFISITKKLQKDNQLPFFAN